ncbi:MAG: shikimate kinase [Acidimicrobiales bacterium]
MSATGLRRGHVVLVGMMGSGKTTVGRLLAERLGRPFFDSDEMVEARTGHTVAELFEASGESGFRAEEAAALADGLADPTPSVIAAAGGTVLDPTNRRLIRQAGADDGLVVWLHTDVAVLAERVVSGTHRPLLADDPRADLERLAAQREPLYAEVADLRLESDDTPDALVARLVDAVAGERQPS